jgi:TPR repeat protein
VHAPQTMKHFLPFRDSTDLPGGSRMRWVPVAMVAAAMAVAVALARPVTPLQQADWLARLAESGDPGAELELGLAYRAGRDGLATDPRTGLYWLKRSAEAGNAFAADQVGNAYAAGDGTPVDRVLARHWWQVSAREGNADARQHLGETKTGPLQAVLSLLTGETFREQARPALLRRAQAGDATAQYQVAMRYRDGSWGFPRDAALSAQWLARAAAAGNPLALKTLAANQVADRNR